MKIYISAIFIFLSLTLAAQDFDWAPLTREIAVDVEDSLVKARILLDDSELKLEDDFMYYWHKKGQINRNMGGYTGDVLHGEYLVFNAENKLITKGQFAGGVKTGVWKSWYTNGNLKTVSEWKNGRLNGVYKSYDITGSLQLEINYKNGLVESEENKTFQIFNTSKNSESNDSIPQTDE